jgi:YHS domain-containing protein
MMKTLTFTAVAAALSFGFALPFAGCDNHRAEASPFAASGAPAANPAVRDDPSVPKLPVGSQAKCPVTGEEFTVKPSTVQVTYAGKRYAFCCADCRPTFEKNLAKFAK